MFLNAVVRCSAPFSCKLKYLFVLPCEVFAEGLSSIRRLAGMPVEKDWLLLKKPNQIWVEDIDKQRGMESWWGCSGWLIPLQVTWSHTVLFWFRHELSQKREVWVLGSAVRAEYHFPDGRPCPSLNKTTVQSWPSRHHISSLMLSLSPVVAPCPQGAVTHWFEGCLSDLSVEAAGKENVERCTSGSGPLLASAVDLFFFSPWTLQKCTAMLQDLQGLLLSSPQKDYCCWKSWGFGLAINFIRKASFRPS